MDVSDGCDPVVTNALSSRLTAEVRRDGVRWVQDFERGVAAGPPVPVGLTTGSGTVIAFRPDAHIFDTVECSFDVLAEHFRELAFLNRGLDISLADQRPQGGRGRRGSSPRAEFGTSSPSSTHRPGNPLSVKLDRPEFEGATRGVLGNAEVRGCVAQAVREHLGTRLEEDPQLAAILLSRFTRGPTATDRQRRPCTLACSNSVR